MKRVLVFGTFDVLHPGHLNFLKQARSYGSWLIVSVARDTFVRSIKGREPLHNEGRRITNVLETGLVDEAHLSDSTIGTYGIIKKTHPDVVCLGHDQEQLMKDLKRWLKEHQLTIETAVMKPYFPEKYKSSKIIPLRKTP